MSLRSVFSLLLLAIVIMSSSIMNATPAIHGGTGFVTMPGTGTIKAGEIYLGGHYIGGEPCIAINLGGGLIDKWELTGAFEDQKNGAGSPYVNLSSKYRYYEGSSAHSALGISSDIATDDASGDDFKFSIYNALGRTAFGGEFAIGFGYTFESGNKNVNFWMGYSLEILDKVLFIESDFSNIPYRFPWGGPGYTGIDRGIANIALRFHLFETKLRLDLGILDAMDENRKGYIGGNFKFNI